MSPNDPSRLPPPHWRENDGWESHPQEASAWDWDQDGPENNPKERSRLRLCFAGDRADPRAPEEMALVLRVNLSRVVGELVWRRAQVEMYQGKAPAPNAVGTFFCLTPCAHCKHSGCDAQEQWKRHAAPPLRAGLKAAIVDTMARYPNALAALAITDQIEAVKTQARTAYDQITDRTSVA